MNTDYLIFGDDDFAPSRFNILPNKLNGHRVFYKGKAATVKETREERALAEVAQKKWTYYKDNYQPLENEYMRKVDAQDTDGARDFATGMAASATTAEFGGAAKEVASGMAEHGINPNSGKAKFTMSGLSDAQAGASSEAKAQALNSQDDAYVGGLSNVVAIGNNKSTTATAGLSELAQTASAKAANDAQNSFNNRAARLSAIGSVAGAVGYGMTRPPPPGTGGLAKNAGEVSAVYHKDYSNLS